MYARLVTGYLSWDLTPCKSMQVDAKAMVQYSKNIADLAKGTPGGKQGSRGYPYLGSFHAAAEAAASKLQAVEGGFRWDALRQGSCRIPTWLTVYQSDN